MYFSMVSGPNRVLTTLKSASNIRISSLVTPSKTFVWECTKILEGRTNLSECVFDALFRGVSTRYGLRIVENYFEHTFGKVGLAFQNLRLGSINFVSGYVSETELSH